MLTAAATPMSTGFLHIYPKQGWKKGLYHQAIRWIGSKEGERGEKEEMGEGKRLLTFPGHSTDREARKALKTEGSTKLRACESGVHALKKSNDQHGYASVPILPQLSVLTLAENGASQD